MKKLPIRKMKKLLSDKKWLNKKYKHLIDASDSWNYFQKFQCEPSFRGYRKAAYNQKIYDKKIFKIKKQLDFLEKLGAE